jgi:hypothetical protein
MSDDASEAMPPACRGWIERWFGIRDVQVVAELLAPWTRDRTLRWTYLLVDAVVREVVATVLETAGASELAARHRALKPVRDPESAAPAIEQLGESMKEAQSVGVRPLFLSSTRRGVQEVVCLDREYRQSGVLDPMFLEILFAKAGCFDMSMHRGIASGTSREAVVAVYRARAFEPFGAGPKSSA